MDTMLWQEKAGARYMYYVLSLAWLRELTPLPLPNPSPIRNPNPKPKPKPKPKPGIISQSKLSVLLTLSLIAGDCGVPLHALQSCYGDAIL